MFRSSQGEVQGNPEARQHERPIRLSELEERPKPRAEATRERIDERHASHSVTTDPMSTTDGRSAGPTADAGLLNTIDKSLEEMRAIITCRVCVRPLYEPFTIECGHTFCYSCLASWFEKNTHNKTCPECRAKITRKPAPTYLIREITQLFSTRAELLPAGETTKEHETQQRVEAFVVEDDKQGPGLFRGCFKEQAPRLFGAREHIIIDDEDGVGRCPRCSWEVERGECLHCGWHDDAEIGSDADSVEEVDGHPIAIYGHGYPDEMGDEGYPYASDSLEDDSDEDGSAGSLVGFIANDQDDPEDDEPGSEVLRVFRAGSEQSMRDQSEDFLYDPNYPDNVVDHETDADTTESHSSRTGLEDLGLWRTDASGDDIMIPGVRGRRQRTLESVQTNSVEEGASMPPQGEIYHVPSDSDESVVQTRTRRGRDARNSRHYITSSSPNPGTDDDSRGATGQEQNSPRSPPGRQLLRTATTRPVPLFPSSDDGDLGSLAGETTLRQRQLEQTTRGETTRPSQPSSSLIYTTHSSDRPSRPLRTTPTHSTRERINMPGAFPLSFHSEEGQSQPTPLLNSQGTTSSSPSTQQTSSNGTTSHPSRRPDPHFFDRRRHDDRPLHSPADDLPRRDNEARKAARRQERQRLKAEQDARRRRDGYPAVPPMAAS